VCSWSGKVEIGYLQEKKKKSWHGKGGRKTLEKGAARLLSGGWRPSKLAKKRADARQPSKGLVVARDASAA